jgi:hypothetical protein
MLLQGTLRCLDSVGRSTTLFMLDTLRDLNRVSGVLEGHSKHLQGTSRVSTWYRSGACQCSTGLVLTWQLYDLNAAIAPCNLRMQH